MANNQKIVTRFAPSPSGFLHIGGARTALFNFLYSKRYAGSFLLRIEDTDKERSKDTAIYAIIDSLRWLGIAWNGDVVLQSQRQTRYREIAEQLLDSGKAYRCYLSQEEIAALRRDNPYSKIRSPWRNSTKPAPFGKKYSIRLKIDDISNTEVIVNDAIQGTVAVSLAQLDDMILLRANGISTYMLAVVVDDYDMGITHIIRGNDHFTNTFRQLQIYKALNWHQPVYAHIPLIHNIDGHKLSKRNNAVDVLAYRDMGYLPEAMCNYLLRLGWGHGDIEIINVNDAAKIFALEDVGKAPARFDVKKLNFLNAYYIAKCNDNVLLQHINTSLGLHTAYKLQKVITHNIHEVKRRARTLIELAEIAKLYIMKMSPPDQKSQLVIANQTLYALLPTLITMLAQIDRWEVGVLKDSCQKFAVQYNIAVGLLLQLLRATIIGSFQSPPIYEMMVAIGKEECIKRMNS